VTFRHLRRLHETQSLRLELVSLPADVSDLARHAACQR